MASIRHGSDFLLIKYIGNNGVEKSCIRGFSFMEQKSKEAVSNDATASFFIENTGCPNNENYKLSCNSVHSSIS